MRFVIKPSKAQEDQPVVTLSLDMDRGLLRLVAEDDEAHLVCVLEINPSGAVSLANNEALHWVGLRRGL